MEEKLHDVTHDEAREFITLLQQLRVEQQAGIELIIDGLCLLESKEKSGTAAKNLIRP
jgi:hypothetical protein